MTVKIATAPCSWGVWYADGSPSGVPWNIFLDQAKEAGYKAFELGPLGYLPTDTSALRREIDKRGLELSAGTVCYDFSVYKNFSDFKENIDILCKTLKEFNASYIVAMDGSDVGQFSEKKADYTENNYKKYFQMFKDLGEYTLAKYSIETVFHPHAVTVIETEKEIEDMLKYTNLNLAFDTGHHACVNGKPENKDESVIKFMRKHKEKIKYLHFKNVDWKIYKKLIDEKLGINWGFDNYLMCDLEDGSIDFVELKKFLDEINFNGIAVIEQDIPKADGGKCAFEGAKRNLKYLKQIKMI